MQFIAPLNHDIAELAGGDRSADGARIDAEETCGFGNRYADGVFIAPCVIDGSCGARWHE